VRIPVPPLLTDRWLLCGVVWVDILFEKERINEWKVVLLPLLLLLLLSVPVAVDDECSC